MNLKPLIYLLALCLAVPTLGRDLFSPPSAHQIQSASLGPAPETARSRVVNPAVDALAGLRAEEATDLRLNLFDDLSFGIIVHTRAEDPKGFSVSGQLREDETGSFHFVVRDGVLVGLVRSPARGQIFRINYGPDGTQRITQVIESKMGECGNAHSPRVHASPPVPAVPADSVCNSDPIGDITVLVAYTDIARTAAGGTTAMEAECQLAVDTANQAYTNSQISARLRLIHTVEVTYNEAGTFDDHLARLESTNDGIMDNLHTIRDEYGADLVDLIVEDDDGGTTCGLGNVMETLSNGFGTRAFTVTNRGCASGNFSLVHEIGHNLGCDHDRENAGTGRLYPYSYGWRFNGSDMQQYRTVMAYSPGTRIGYFSNPNVTFLGAPTGVAINQTNQSNNAQTINLSEFTGGNWRRSNFWVDFNYTGSSQTGCIDTPYKTVAAAVAAAPKTGVINFKPGTRNEIVTINKPLVLKAVGGAVTIGQ